MIKKTRLKIVIVVESIIAFILIIVCASIIISSYLDMNFHIKESLSRTIEKVTDNRPNLPLKSREFSAIVGNNNIKIDYDNKFYEESEVTFYIDEILNRDVNFGKVKKISFIKMIKDNKIVIVGVDTSVERGIIQKTLVYMLGFGIFGLTILAFIMWFLSKWIMDPINKNIEAQKVFISDASHELKTPITSIIANMTILEEEVGLNKWSNNVINQAQRLSVLSEELLTLSRLDENRILEKKTLDFSLILKSIVLSFESIAYENNKEIDLIVKDNISIYANEIELNRLLDICIDNAIKHSLENEKIIIKLDHPNETVLSIYNKTNTITKAEKDQLFNRFYRGDNSRSRQTGGSGLGLSIAKKIIENNKWKINVKIQEKESIEFIIQF